MVLQVHVLPFALLALNIPHVIVALLWLEYSSCTDQGRSPCAEQALRLGEKLAPCVKAGPKNEEVRVIHKADPHLVHEAPRDWCPEACAMASPLVDLYEDC